jgi:hypothetical protein
MEHEKKVALKDYSSHHRSRRHRGFTVHFFRFFPFFLPTLWNLPTATTYFNILCLAVLTKKERKKKKAEALAVLKSNLMRKRSDVCM